MNNPDLVQLFRKQLDPGPQAWRLDAACRGMNPELFHPRRGCPITPALAVCATCPVSTECAEHATRYVENQGVWGGTTARQRRETRVTRTRYRAAS